MRQSRKVQRDKPLGGWRNFFQSLEELVEASPDADAYLMAQDDALFCRNVRDLLEQALWPAERLGVVTIYCSFSYVSPEVGWQSIERPEDLKGAVALIFPRASARLFLSTAEAISERVGKPFASIDTKVGRWATEMELPVYCWSPSLVQHIGDTSTLWPGAPNRGIRHSPNYPGENFDARQLLPEVQTPLFKS